MQALRPWLVATRIRRIHSVQAELLRKSKEAALNAVQTYNNPLTTFKSEAFIVQMVIAWMYLLHAYYRSKGIDYTYYAVLPSGRKKYDRTKNGAIKHWELERCLNAGDCPLDGPTKANLRFLIGLRHKIEHQICLDLDQAMAGRYLACCLNYESTLVSLFGEQHSVEEALPFAMQFRSLMTGVTSDEIKAAFPGNVSKYIEEFEESLSDEEYQSQCFSVRLIFIQKQVNRKGQADKVFEFVSPESELATAIETQYWVIKETERPKYRPSEVIERVQAQGYPRFGMYHHTSLWKGLNAKNPGLGYGVEVSGQWYWYERWVERVLENCASNHALYGPENASG